MGDQGGLGTNLIDLTPAPTAPPESSATRITAGLACITIGLWLHGAAWSWTDPPSDERLVALAGALALTVVGPWFFPLDVVWRLLLSFSVAVFSCAGACCIAVLVHIALVGGAMPTPGSGPAG